MKLRTFLMSLVLAACTPLAYAQFNLNNLDVGKMFSGGKSLVTAATGVSEEQEIAIGHDLAGRLLAQVPLMPDPRVQEYVNRVGRWVASQSERPELPWRFAVLNAANVNAMAMPGGTILITRGLYEMLDNEAQLAGVLGHEIAHVVKRHHINVMRQQSAISGLADIASSRVGGNGQVLKQAALNFFRDLFITGLDKGSEYEADSMGVILAARAGYNAFALVDVLHMMSLRAANDPAVVDLFASHPLPNDRIAHLGDQLSPREAELSSGREPDITRVSPGTRASRPKPTAAAPAARQFTNEPAAASAPNANSTQPAEQVVNPAEMVNKLKGLFGR